MLELTPAVAGSDRDEPIDELGQAIDHGVGTADVRYGVVEGVTARIGDARTEGDL
jgi:hypothetical protein